MEIQFPDPRIKHGRVVGSGLTQKECTEAANTILARLHQVPDIDFPNVSIVELGLVRGIHVRANGETIVYLTLTTPECKHAELILDLCTQALGVAIRDLKNPHLVNAAIEPLLGPHTSSSGEISEATDCFIQKLANSASHPAVEARKWEPADATPGARERIRAALLEKSSPPLTIGGRSVAPGGNESARAAVFASVTTFAGN